MHSCVGVSAGGVLVVCKFVAQSITRVVMRDRNLPEAESDVLNANICMRETHAHTSDRTRGGEGGGGGAGGGPSPTTSSSATADELDPQGLGVGAETTQTGGVANYQLKHLFFLTFFVCVHAVRTGSCQLPSH